MKVDQAPSFPSQLPLGVNEKALDLLAMVSEIQGNGSRGHLIQLFTFL